MDKFMEKHPAGIKTFLIDLDGVVLHRPGYFTERAKVLYPNANHEAILDFFKGGLYGDVTRGMLSLEEALSKILPDWNIDTDTEVLLKTWFEEENNIDREVVDHIQDIRKNGIQCVIATDHSLYRKNDVWNNLRMKDYFDGIVASSDVGATKEEPEFYQRAMKMLDIQEPEEVMFTDDDPKNVEVAKTLGITGIVYEGLKSLKFTV